VQSNGCCAHTLADRLAGMTATLKPQIEPEEIAERPGSLVQCSTKFFRDCAPEVLDLVGIGRTVYVNLNLAPDADAIAVVMPWAEYYELITMRDKIAGITGAMQRAG
jgi:hypothetical protein